MIHRIALQTQLFNAVRVASYMHTFTIKLPISNLDSWKSWVS